MTTDGALALAANDADITSAEWWLSPKNRVNAFRAFAEDDARENVLEFPYWRLGKAVDVRQIASAKLKDQIGSTRAITDPSGGSTHCFADGFCGINRDCLYQDCTTPESSTCVVDVFGFPIVTSNVIEWPGQPPIGQACSKRRRSRTRCSG